MDKELKPCPMCGESERLLIETPSEFADCYVHCFSCGCKGPLRFPNRHITAWNTRAYEQELTKLRSENESLKNGIQAAADVINHSSGVAGLHLNGDVAPWTDLLTGGAYEEWLTDFSTAIKALSTKEAESD